MKGSSVIVALLAACVTNVASFPTGSGESVAVEARSPVGASHELWARKKKNGTTAATKGNKKNKTAAAGAAQASSAAATTADTNTNTATTDLLTQLEAALGGSANSDILTSIESLLGKRHHQGKTTKAKGNKNATAKAAKNNARDEEVDEEEVVARSIEELQEQAEIFARHHQGKKTAAAATGGKNKTAKANKANNARSEEVGEANIIARSLAQLEERIALFTRHHQGKTTKSKNSTKAATAKGNKANNARDESSAEEEEVVARSAEEIEARAELFKRHHQGKTTKAKNSTKAAKAAKANNARDESSVEEAEN